MPKKLKIGNKNPLRLDNEISMNAPTYDGTTNGRVQRIKTRFLKGISERVRIHESGIEINKQVVVTVRMSKTDFKSIVAV